MPVKDEFIIKLKGKSFVLLTGLLDLAHSQGLAGIETRLVPELCDPQSSFYAVHATGRFRDSEGIVTVWSAMGDASPASSQLHGAELRHAETRAIARMLRMATNCGITAFEELPPEEKNGGFQPMDTRHGNGEGQREERPSQPRAVNNQENGHSQNTEGVAACQECGLVMTPAQRKLSLHKYGACFCLTHQAGRKVTTTIA